MNNDNQKQFSIEENKPADWFEPLYAGANKDGEGVPWANMDTHPSFQRWLKTHPLKGEGRFALVVGCGMGDDAVELEKLGFEVTAFDVSETAIMYCRERFPDSTVNFVQADLLLDQRQWIHQFDFVLEIYTVQALRPKYEATLIRNISSFVASGGELLVIAEVSNKARAFEDGPPWLLTPQHTDAFVSCGLCLEDQAIENDETSQEDMQTYVTLFKRPTD